MRRIWIKQFGGYIVDAITFDAGRTDYTAVDVDEMPYDIMCGCYQLIDGALVRDDVRHARVTLENSNGERLRSMTERLGELKADGVITAEQYEYVADA